MKRAWAFAFPLLALFALAGCDETALPAGVSAVLGEKATLMMEPIQQRDRDQVRLRDCSDAGDFNQWQFQYQYRNGGGDGGTEDGNGGGGGNGDGDRDRLRLRDGSCGD